ncbi:hypothetical protein LCGC14_0620480 [marine sediment metagenome]|uniref:Uncharacterized protein n=1 Tax=marine sediment metagenome TaxID=412755 RepID=A0A0F9R4W7_9ZZZZ
MGRQSGKSWLARYISLDNAINQGKYVMWISPTIPSARTHWNEMLALLDASGLPIKRISRNEKEIHFHGGGVLAVRSAIDPDNLRGPTVDLLILDEAAFYRRGDYVWYSVCLPMITASRGKALFTTTPNGKNWVYDLFNMGNEEDNDFYRSWHMTSLEAPFQDEELLLELKETMPELKWLEEFMAEFLDDKGGVFSGLKKAMCIQPLDGPLQGHQYVAGIDFGHTTDATAITILDKYTREQVWGAVITNVGTVKVILKLVTILKLWQPVITHIERNGIGEGLYDLLKLALQGEDITALDWHMMSPVTTGEEEVAGGLKLKALYMQHDLKVQLVERLAADVEYGGLKLLVRKSKYGEVQASEMNTYERQRTARTDSITYNAANGCHDDTVTALYVAYKGIPKRKKFRLPKGKKKSQKNPFKGGGKNFHAERNRIRSRNKSRPQ